MNWFAIFQEQDVKNPRHGENMENLDAEVRKITCSFAKLQSEQMISKIITAVLSGGDTQY